MRDLTFNIFLYHSQCGLSKVLSVNIFPVNKLSLNCAILYSKGLIFLRCF